MSSTCTLALWRLAPSRRSQSLPRIAAGRVRAAQVQLPAVARRGRRTQPGRERPADRGSEARIDRYNQQRNDYIERIDAFLIDWLAREGIAPQKGARLNTETPGSSIDRLSILSLRIYHLQEQVDRTDATAEHKQKAADRLAICQSQCADLSGALEELLADITSGRKRLQLYRQLKMYNDPTMNPYLYEAPQKVA